VVSWLSDPPAVPAYSIYENDFLLMKKYIHNNIN
jgi:hypothetical protein